jgi:hypothetical protein
MELHAWRWDDGGSSLPHEHLLPCLAMGAGASRQSSAIVLSTRPLLRLTRLSNSGSERPFSFFK